MGHSFQKLRGVLIVGWIDKYLLICMVFQIIYRIYTAIRQKAALLRSFGQVKIVESSFLLIPGVSDNASQPLGALPWHRSAGKDNSNGGLRNVNTLVHRFTGNENPKGSVPETIQRILIGSPPHLGMAAACLFGILLLQEPVQLICLGNTLAENENFFVFRQAPYQFTGTGDPPGCQADQGFAHIGEF